MKRPIITLLTDFGTRDGYTASMKGVILGICPHARLVDVSHDIPPQDIRAGAFLLSVVYEDFPPGTIHLAVVDPGVGTSRNPVAMKAGNHCFVGPDNGLFARVMGKEPERKTVRIENPAYRRSKVSHTFHGRDLFAPAAAWLAMGIPPERLGPIIVPDTIPLGIRLPEGESLTGEIVYIDRFGNAVTDLHESVLRPFTSSGPWRLEVGDRSFQPFETYEEAPQGIPIVLIGGGGYLEIAVKNGHAAGTLNLRTGTRTQVKKHSPLLDKI